MSAKKSKSKSLSRPDAPMTEARRFISERGFGVMRAERDTRRPTHFVLNRLCGVGVLQIPLDQEFEFLRIVASELAQGIPHSIHEVRSPVFPMFFEIDYANQEEDMPTGAELQRWIGSVILPTVGRFFPDVDDETYEQITTAIVASRPVVRKEDVFLSIGLHIILLNCLVNDAQAMTMHQAVVAAFEEISRDHHSIPWTRIIDPNPLIQPYGGMRILHCQKSHTCDYCGTGLNREVCMCSPRTVVVEPNKAYSVIGVPYLRRDGTLANRDDCLAAWQDPYSAMVAASLHRPTGQEVTPGWTLPDGVPLAPTFSSMHVPKEYAKVHGEIIALITTLAQREKDDGPASVAVGTKRKLAHLEALAPDVWTDTIVLPPSMRFASVGQVIRSLSNEFAYELHADDPIIRQVEFAIRTLFHDVYPYVLVDMVIWNAKKRHYSVFVKGPGSQRCQNLTPRRGNHAKAGRAEHGNHMAYFTITEKGISQRCTCRCTGTDALVDRRFGLCSKYRSRPIALGPELHCALYKDADALGRSVLDHELKDKPPTKLPGDALLINRSNVESQ